MKKIILIAILFLVIILGVFYMFMMGDYMKIKEKSNNTTTTKITEKKAKEVIEDIPKIEIINGVAYIDGILIVNKTYGLPEDYKPTDPYTQVGEQNYCTTCLNKDVYEKFLEMEADATTLGLNLWIQSGYRSYTLQSSLYNGYIERDGKELADTYSARPGHSEHQTGLAFDLNTITDDFAYTNEGKWVNENAYRYGFILRYPKSKENYTGYKYEPWHLRYVGIDLAQKLYNNGDWITLEEYYNLTSTYE